MKKRMSTKHVERCGVDMDADSRDTNDLGCDGACQFRTHLFPFCPEFHGANTGRWHDGSLHIEAILNDGGETNFHLAWGAMLTLKVVLIIVMDVVVVVAFAAGVGELLGGAVDWLARHGARHGELECSWVGGERAVYWGEERDASFYKGPSLSPTRVHAALIKKCCQL